MQERWFQMRERHPEMSSIVPFRVHRDLTLTGPLDLNALTVSWSALVRRQWSFRSAFSREGDRVWMVVVEPSTAQLEVRDLRGAADPDQRLLEIVRELYAQPLDAHRGELVRATVVRLGDDHHRLVLVWDHLAIDGPSVDRAVGELFTAYEAVCQNPGRDPYGTVGELGCQYADWAQEQWALLASGTAASIRDFWTEQLAGAEDLLLPMAGAASADFGPATSAKDTFDAACTEQLKSFVAEARVTTSMALLSVLFVLLHRASGQKDLSVTVPADARPRRYSGVIGYFTCPLIIRVRLTDDLTFRQLCQVVGDRVLAAYANARVPLYTVVAPRRGLWRVGFNYQRRDDEPRACSLNIRRSTHVPTMPRWLDLAVSLFLHDHIELGVIRMNAVTRTDVLDQGAGNRMLRGFAELAGDLLASPDRPIRSAPARWS